MRIDVAYIASILLPIAFSLTLAGCGGGTDPGSAVPPAPPPPPPPPVSAVYSFASPPLSVGQQITNDKAEDGCFPGLRTWVRNVEGEFDLVARATANFEHVRQATLDVTVNEESVGTFNLDEFTTPLWDGTAVRTECSPSSNFAPGGRQWCADLDACHVRYYFFRYGKVVGLPELETYHRFCKDAEELWSWETTLSEARKSGFQLVHHVAMAAAIGYSDVDNLLLYQDKTSLACVMSIEGSDLSLNDWISNLHITTTQWCGFQRVHKGLSLELQNIVLSDAWATMKGKLAQCASVTLTGHSKGGGLVNLLAACANRNETLLYGEDKTMYDALSWTFSAPNLLPEITAPSLQVNDGDLRFDETSTAV